jgi:single-strand DNA-binding protein
MASFNKVVLLGNLTRDPEMRYTPKGTPIAKFSLGINRVWKDEAGEKREDVTFVDCSTFGKSAETLEKYVKKGSPLLVEGRLEQDTWDDKETGQKRSKISVVVESFQFVGGKRDTEQAE